MIVVHVCYLFLFQGAGATITTLPRCLTARIGVTTTSAKKEAWNRRRVNSDQKIFRQTPSVSYPSKLVPARLWFPDSSSTLRPNAARASSTADAEETEIVFPPGKIANQHAHYLRRQVGKVTYFFAHKMSLSCILNKGFQEQLLLLWKFFLKLIFDWFMHIIPFLGFLSLAWLLRIITNLNLTFLYQGLVPVLPQITQKCRLGDDQFNIGDLLRYDNNRCRTCQCLAPPGNNIIIKFKNL